MDITDKQRNKKYNLEPGNAIQEKFFSEFYGDNQNHYARYQRAINQITRVLLAEIYWLERFYCHWLLRSSMPYPHWHNTEHKAHREHKHKEEKEPISTQLITEAKHNIGRPVWAFSKFASLCQAGYLGCAATVSNLLQDAGMKIPGSASVSGLVRQLHNRGWQQIKINDKKQFRPGDVVYGINGPHAHIGIISQIHYGKIFVCDNSSSSGTLKERTIEEGGSFTPNGRFSGHLYVMRQNS